MRRKPNEARGTDPHAFKIDLRAKWQALGAMAADRQLSAGALAVAHALLDLTNPATGVAWPGVEYLANRTGLSPRATERAIGQLIGAGWFLKADNAGGRHKSNRYAFARWETPASATGLDGETPASVARNPGANRQETPASTTGESYKESIFESGQQRNLRVFGVLEPRGERSAPAKPADPATARLQAALAAPELADFQRRVPKAANVMRLAYEAERQGEGDGVAILREALAAAPAKRASGGGR